ncbi:DUF6795 domain-containing protein [Teredinibacter turnerae]|uniref:DUF6795 domain-containing protein n=1 Tax=Teredinibacter turnerae TaxID=2426 RepID=UPI0005F7895A|nr:DUF6795 domain-containing protein [Teredinibacter turnerae]
MLFIKNPPPTSYVISSPLSGLLQKDGVEQAFYSDENGDFDLPAHEETLEIPALVPFVAKTDLYAIVDGKRDQFWFSSKMDKGIDSEFERPPAGMVCDLTTEMTRIESSGGLCGSTCNWN